MTSSPAALMSPIGCSPVVPSTVCDCGTTMRIAGSPVWGLAWVWSVPSVWLPWMPRNKRSPGCGRNWTSERLEGVSLTKFLRRPEIAWADLLQRRPDLADVDSQVAWQVQCDIKYAGYIARQETEIGRQRRLAAKRIPADLDYASIGSLRAEAREKLSRVRPTSLDQASRISGITPADIGLLMTHLAAKPRSRKPPNPDLATRQPSIGDPFG